MKIFYAVQATGNGHIARAIELMPGLQQHGTVDVFLSGNNSHLEINLPVRYRSKGLSLFYHKKGGLDYAKIFNELSMSRMYNDAIQLPVEKYDIVINDFEIITAQACRIKKIPSISFGHQASFQSEKSPRPPGKNFMSEFILKKYAVASVYAGLHFEQYDDFIFNPVIKQDILNATPRDKGHVTVYLPHYADEVVAKQLSGIKDLRFEVFSKQVKEVTALGNISFIPISNKAFNQSLVNCAGIITGAGFETPAEALYFGKKLLCIPIKGQYEQLCNAAALKNFGVTIINGITENFSKEVIQWIIAPLPRRLSIKHSTKDITDYVINKALNLRKSTRFTADAYIKETV